MRGSISGMAEPGGEPISLRISLRYRYPRQIDALVRQQEQHQTVQYKQLQPCQKKQCQLKYCQVFPIEQQAYLLLLPKPPPVPAVLYGVSSRRTGSVAALVAAARAIAE